MKNQNVIILYGERASGKTTFTRSLTHSEPQVLEYSLERKSSDIKIIKLINSIKKDLLALHYECVRVETIIIEACAEEIDSLLTFIQSERIPVNKIIIEIQTSNLTFSNLHFKRMILHVLKTTYPNL